jgi:hypothetical protein
VAVSFSILLLGQINTYFFSDFLVGNVIAVSSNKIVMKSIFLYNSDLIKIKDI